MIITQPRYAHCTFCDDIRHEIDGKCSIIGVYTSDMNITGIAPILIPRLIILVNVFTPIDDPLTKLNIEVIGPPFGDNKIGLEIPFLQASPPKEGRDVLYYNISSSFTLAPCVIYANGIIEVIVETEREAFCAGRLHVCITPPSIQDITPTIGPLP